VAINTSTLVILGLAEKLTFDTKSVNYKQ